MPRTFPADQLSVKLVPLSDFGIRESAQRTRIAKLMLFSAAKLALIGCSLGVLGSLMVSRVIESLLFEVSANDPFIYLAGVMIMVSTAILAAAVPARRVASVDPLVSLRSM